MPDNKTLNEVSLSDKYEKDTGRIFISGTQALARLPLIQKKLDATAGLNTQGFISGYRGSPLGVLDSTLWQEKKRMEAGGVVFQPGVNEDLAATAVWGTQQLEFFPDPQVDGVYAMWYGKAPGVDRSADVMRHANAFGTHKHGGVIVVVGDDHPGKSSTVVNQSEPLLSALSIPTLYPSNVQEIIDFGLLGWELSRYSGLWVSLKTVNETVEQTQTIDIDLNNVQFVRPDRGASEDQANIKPTAFNPQAMEVTVKRIRLPLVHQFVRANGIDKVKLDGEGGLGIVTSGKSYTDVLQALSLIGLDEAMARSLGIAIYKVGCVWPLEPQGLKVFAAGRPELLFIEEKTPMLEGQTAQLLFNDSERPRLIGKQDENGAPLLPSDLQLTPAIIADAIMARLGILGQAEPGLCSRHQVLQYSLASNAQPAMSSSGMRLPYFCSGCPHNTSTKLPEGSRAMAGIGCHGMAIMKRTDTLLPIHMGGEGINWAGAAPFSGTRHMFQNLGDGTYFHSGLLAIRAAVSSGVNITYKILYNDAVAMTGGQPIDGPISVADMIRQVAAESVKKVVLVSDEPNKYKGSIPTGTDIYHRDDLDMVQRQLREIEGTTILIYEQTCAAEKRRRRKRGQYPNPAKRLFINDAVCEGCGDCSVQSTCVSIQPKLTLFGTKREIDQSSCNKDYSCIKGFCPSFVTVLGAEPKKPQGADLSANLFNDLPSPTPQPLHSNNMAVMIAGIGGTGVITVGAIMGMAAHLEGKVCSIYDMTGLSQKNGAVYSHLRIADSQDAIAAQKIGAGEADLVLGFDLIAALMGDAAITYHPDKTRVIGNSMITPTSDFQFNRDQKIDAHQVEAEIVSRTSKDNAFFIDATTLAFKLCGDTIAANMFVVGYAAQKGLLPISIDSLEKAIELNGVAIPFNLNAFSLGRLFAHDPAKIEALLPEKQTATEQTLEQLIDARAQHLGAYQNNAYATRYRAFIEQVKKAEAKISINSTALTRAVAINLSKLMAYKDEYEVARLYTDPAFLKKLDDQFEPGYSLRFNMAPPLISKSNRSTGLPIKGEYGPWMMKGFKVLSKMKGLRGGMFDIFGKKAERKMERQLISDYEYMIQNVVNELSSGNLATAIELALLPDKIRGFGHVKKQAVAEYVTRKAELLKSWSESRQSESRNFEVQGQELQQIEAITK